MQDFDWQSFFVNLDGPESENPRVAKWTLFDAPPKESGKPKAPEKPKEPKTEPSKQPEKAKEPPAYTLFEAPPVSPPELAKPKPEKPAKWDQFLELFYEGGKKKVPNPNPKTKKKYPEVQVDTALKDPTFHAKVTKEYEAWLAQGAQAPKELEKPKEKIELGDKVSVPSEVTVGEFVRGKDDGEEWTAVVTYVGPEGIMFQRVDPKTGKAVGASDAISSKLFADKELRKAEPVDLGGKFKIGDVVRMGLGEEDMPVVALKPTEHGIQALCREPGGLLSWVHEKYLRKSEEKKPEEKKPEKPKGKAVSKPGDVERYDVLRWISDEQERWGVVNDKGPNGVWVTEYDPETGKEVAEVWFPATGLGGLGTAGAEKIDPKKAPKSEGVVEKIKENFGEKEKKEKKEEPEGMKALTDAEKDEMFKVLEESIDAWNGSPSDFTNLRKELEKHFGEAASALYPDALEQIEGYMEAQLEDAQAEKDEPAIDHWTHLQDQVGKEIEKVQKALGKERKKKEPAEKPKGIEALTEAEKKEFQESCEALAEDWDGLEFDFEYLKKRLEEDLGDKFTPEVHVEALENVRKRLVHKIDEVDEDEAESLEDYITGLRERIDAIKKSIHEKLEIPEGKAKVGDEVLDASQLEEGDWIQSETDPGDFWTGKVVEVGPDYIMVQDYVHDKMTLAGKPWRLESHEIASEPTKKIEPKKVKQKLPGKEVKSLKGLEAGDVLKMYDYDKDELLTGQVTDAKDDGWRVKLVDPKTGKVLGSRFLDPETFADRFQVHKLPASKIPKKLKKPEKQVGEKIGNIGDVAVGDHLVLAPVGDEGEKLHVRVLHLPTTAMPSHVEVQQYDPTTGEKKSHPYLISKYVFDEGRVSRGKPPEKEPEKPEGKLKVGDKVTGPDDLEAGMVLEYGDKIYKIIKEEPSGHFRIREFNPKTGKWKTKSKLLHRAWVEHHMPKQGWTVTEDPTKLEQPEKAKEPEKKPKGKTKAVDAGKWKLKTEHVPFEDIKAGDVVHTKDYGPQRVVGITGTGVRLESGVVLTKSKLEKGKKEHKGKFVISRGDKPQKETPPEPPERPEGKPVTAPDQVETGDVIEYEHNGVTYRGEVVSWDEPGQKFRVRVLYPPQYVEKYESYDEETGEKKYKTPSFDQAKIDKRTPRILTKNQMEAYDAKVKDYTAQLKQIDKKYAEDVAEYEAAMAGKKEVTTGELKHVHVPETWNRESTIARDADRFLEQYRAMISDDVKKIVHGMSAEQKYWHGTSPMWKEMSQGERKLAAAGHLAASQFKKLLTDEEWEAWRGAISSWQGSSGAHAAHKLMGGLETLGVEGGPKSFESANVQHYREEGRKNEALHRAIAKAMAYSQLVYDALGLDHVTVYRGTKTKPVKDAAAGKKIKTTTARELASFSIDPQVAYNFGSASAGKRVVRYRVPVHRLFASPVTYGPLSSAQSPYSENEYLVMGQDGMVGKVMPKSKGDFNAQTMSLDFDPETEKLAAWLPDDDEVLEIEFSEYEEDWLRPHVIRDWWRPLEPPAVRTAARLLELARQDVDFRRAVIGVLGRPRKAQYSLFDAPPQTQTESQATAVTFDQWWAKRYEGGKKKIPNPNPKTRDKYPQIQAGTAMKYPDFRKKVFAEYQQETGQQPAAPEPKKPRVEEGTPGVPEGMELPEESVKGLAKVFKDMEQNLESAEGLQHYVEAVAEVLPPDISAEDKERVHRELMRDLAGSFKAQEQAATAEGDEGAAAMYKGVADGIEKRLTEMAGKPKKKPKPKKEPEKPKKEPKTIDVDSGDFKQVGPQSGSNPGGLYEASDGARYYVKTPQTEDHARNEILTAKLYELGKGFRTPDVGPATRKGKVSVYSRIIPDLEQDEHGLKEGDVPGVGRGVGFDAWLANWDVVGLEYDNLLRDEEGDAVRVDTGGGLRYRAMGKPKGNAFGPEVTEMDTFMDPKRRSGSILSRAPWKEISEGIDQVLAIPEDKIRDLVEEWGPKDDAEREKLLKTLLARRESLGRWRDEHEKKKKTARELVRLALMHGKFRDGFLGEMRRLGA